MESSDFGTFSRMMIRVGELYGKSISKGLMEVYWGALQRFDLGSVKQALSSHTQHPDTGKFMPRPSDVVRALQGDSRTQGLLAWSRVAQTIREVGGYSSVVFDDPVIHAVIRDMGGWVTLCQIRVDELPFREKDFTTRYAGYVGHPPAQYPKQLTGMLAHQHGLAGHLAGPPVCIGESQKALQVYQQGEDSAQSYACLPLDHTVLAKLKGADAQEVKK